MSTDIGNIFKQLFEKLKQLWLRFVDLVIHGARDVDNNSTRVFATYEQIAADTRNLVLFLNDLRHFEFNPAWKTRVINVPRAEEGINELLFIVINGFRDKFGLIHQAWDGLTAALRGRGPGQQFPDGSSAMAKVVSYVGDLDVAWQAFGRAYHQLTDLVGMVDDVKRRIETLDDLFLPQGSTKTTVELTYRKRNVARSRSRLRLRDAKTIQNV